MDGRKQKPMIPIACRYIPYDRYFLTHGDPAWKVKHLKQRILARALSLPIDVRRLDPDYVYVPPSTSVSRRKTAKPSKETFAGASGDDGDEPWNARREGRARAGEGAQTSRRAPSPITFAGADGDRDSDAELGEEYFSAASVASGGARAASPSGSSSASDGDTSRRGQGQEDGSDGGEKEKRKTRRRGGSVSPIEFANPIVLRRQKSASMGAFLYEKGVEAGLVPPMPKSEKARGKQKAKDADGESESRGDGDEDGGDAHVAVGEGVGQGGDSDEEEAGYQVDDDDSEDWSDDYDDEDLGSFVRSPTDSKETKELPAERPETPPPGGRILPGGDGTAVPSGGGPVPGGRIGPGGGGVHFAAPATPRNGGKNKKKRKGASIVGPLSKIAKTVTGTSSHQHSQSISSSQSHPHHHSSHSQMVMYGLPPDPSEQILTLPFALMRFSTGQLLEDDLPISWYDLRPYELLEVHFILQPRRFEVSVRLGAILTRTVRGAPFALGDGFMEADDDSRRRHGKSMGRSDPLGQLAMALEDERERDRPRDGFAGAGAVDVLPRPEMFFHTETRELVSLPRGDLDAYVKPYWEGWARALRVMAPAREFHQYPQAGQGRAGPGKYGYAPAYGTPPHGPGGGGNHAKYAAAEHPGAAMMGGGGGAGMAVWDPAMNTYGEEKVREAEVDVDALRGRGRPASPKVGRHQHPYHNHPQPGPGYGPNANRPAKPKPKLEWRERWVIVRDGYIYLFKNRNDTSPTHQLALSGLLDLRDADHLANHQNPKERRSRTAHTAAPQGKAFSPERAQTSHGDERRKQHRRSTSTPRPSTSGIGVGSQDYRLGPTTPGSSGVPPLPQGRVLSPEEAERKRKLDRDLEALRTWDDFGASFNFGKKEKGKDKERVKGGERESERGKLRGKRSADVAGDGDWAEGGRRQRSVEVPRDSGKRKSEDREWLVLEREREEAEKDPRTYIPASRDTAEAAGMKILCAKFRYRSNDPLAGSSKPKHWYTSTGPSLAGDPMPDPEATESMRREEQANGPSVRQASTHPTQMATAPQRAPTVPGRQMGMTAAVSGPTLQSSSGRAESIVAGPVAISSGSKFGLAGLFGKDKESDDPAVRKEKEERKREEKERKAREKEQKQLEKDRKKEDKRRKDEDEFRGISSSSSANVLSTHPSALHHMSRNNFSSISSTPTVRPSEGQSSTNVSSMTLRTDDPPATPKADQSRPQLKISPTSARHNTWDEELDDYDSDVSFSSPVFAHSSESSDDDDFMLAKDRRGYRYGGYHAPANRKRSVPNVASPNTTAEESSSGVGASADKGKAKEKEDSSKMIGQDSSEPRPVRPSGENERGERGEWLVLDLGSDSAFTSLLRIFHRQNPSIPSSFLSATLTSQPDQPQPIANQHESMPSSPIASHESGRDAPRNNVSNLSDEGDDVENPVHPEGLSAFMPHVSNRKAVSAPALPYPEWRSELVQYARFAGMREMDRPLHLAYTAWGRDKQASNDKNTYSQKNKKSDSIWARRTRSSFLRTAERKQFPDEPTQASTASDVSIVLEPQNDDGVGEEDEGRWKRMSLASHVSTIKASKSSASREEATADPLVSLPTDNIDDQSMAGVEDVGTVSRPESSGDETDDEVVLEVFSDEGFTYGRRDEEVAVAEALGWLSDDSDEESEFEWAAWATDLPRQYALSKRMRADNERQRKLIPPAEQVRNEESAPLSPMMFANPFVPDLAEPVMVYDTPRKGIPRPPTPPPKDPEEERSRYIRDKRRWEPHAISVSEPLIHSHPNVSTATLHLHHSSPSSSTVNQTSIPSRAPSSSQLSTQRSGNPQPTLSSPSSIDSLADGQRQSSTRIQGRAASLNINARQNTRLRLQSNPTSPLDDTFSPTLSSGYERETSSQTYPRQRHQRQHSRSVSGGDSIFESDATVEEQEIFGRHYQTASPSRPGGLHHSASMPSTKVASALSGIPRTPQTVTFSSSHDEHDSGLFLPEPSMENMPDDRQPAPGRQPTQLSSSPSSRYAASQSPRHYSGHPPSSPRIPSAKSSSSVLKKRRSDLEKGRAIDPETDVAPPLSPTLSEAGSAFSTMQGNYPTSRGPASSAFPSGGHSSGSGSHTPLDKARALVRRVRSGSSLGGHEIQTVIEEHPQWDSEAGVQQRDGQVEVSSSTGTQNQPKKKKSAIDRLVRGFESSLDFMEGR